MSTLNEALGEIGDMMAGTDDPLTQTIGGEIADLAENAKPDKDVPGADMHRAVHLALVWAAGELAKAKA